MLKKGTKQKNKRYKETENSVAGSRTRFICTFKQLLHLCTTMTACSAGVSQGAQFARESAMLKLSEERRKWGESKGAGSGRGERRENGVFFFLPFPSPLSFFRPRTYRKGYYFYSPQSSTVIKSKMAATTISNTNKVSPTQNTLHCRLQ